MAKKKAVTKSTPRVAKSTVKKLAPKAAIVKPVEMKTIYNKSNCKIELLVEGKIEIIPQGKSIQVPKTFVLTEDIKQLVRG